MNMPKCVCHDVELDQDERCWLKEDGTILCDDGHTDEQREDPFDARDHGTPYTTGHLVASQLPKSHPARFGMLYGHHKPFKTLAQPVSRRKARELLDEWEADTAQRRHTTPNNERTIA